MKAGGFDAESFVATEPWLGDSTYWYPDGSLEVIGDPAIGDDGSVSFEDSNIGRFEAGGGDAYREVAIDRAIAADSDLLLCDVRSESNIHFAPMLYSILLHGEWLDDLEDGALVVRTQRGGRWRGDCDVQEAELNRLGITIEFRRRLSDRKLDVIRNHLSACMSCIARAPIKGEGPVLGPTHIDAARQAIRFRVDASRSGQRTINVLLLSLLDLCRITPIVTVFFVEGVATLKMMPRRRVVVKSFEEEFGRFDRRIELERA